MEGAYLDLAREALSICNSIRKKVTDLEAIKAAIVLEDAVKAGALSSSTPVLRLMKRKVPDLQVFTLLGQVGRFLYPARGYDDAAGHAGAGGVHRRHRRVGRVRGGRALTAAAITHFCAM
jgi:hypothetical protein